MEVSGWLDVPTVYLREIVPCTCRTGGWMRPRIGLDAVAIRKKFMYQPEIELRSSSP
jgi:hypothetical protein